MGFDTFTSLGFAKLFANSFFTRAQVRLIAQVCHNLIRTRGVVNVRDWGAVGDGVANDTAAINACLAHVAANGGTMFFPAGTYNIVPPIQLLSADMPFVIAGESRRLSKIVRATTSPESIFNISGVDDFEIRDLWLDYNNDGYPSSNTAVAGHGIAISNGNNIRVANIFMENWVNSGIIIFHYPGSPAPSAAQEQNNVVENCYLDGKGAANNGILFVDQYRSYMRDCTVVDLGTSSTPQSALQFKNRCYRCEIHDCIAENARHGVAMGTEGITGIAAEHCIISNVIVKNCVWGIYMGNSAYCSFDNINIFKDETGSHLIEMTDAVENSITNIKGHGQLVGSGAYSVKFGGTSADNYVQFSELNVNDTTPEIALFESGTANNTVRVEKLKNTATITFTGQCASDSATGVSGNGLEIGGYPTQELYEIVSGVLTIKNPRVQVVRVNTQGDAATDDLDTINGSGRDGQTLILKSVTSARDVTVKHGTGNIQLAGSADFVHDTINDRSVITYDVLAAKWVEVSRSNNP